LANEREGLFIPHVDPVPFVDAVKVTVQPAVNALRLGDAPGHDSICKAASGLGYAITEASVTTILVVRQITVPLIGMVVITREE
jgi:hypothetical protein